MLNKDKNMEWFLKDLYNQHAVKAFLNILYEKHKIKPNKIKVSGFFVYYFNDKEI